MIVAAAQQARRALVVRFAANKDAGCQTVSSILLATPANAELYYGFKRNGPEGPFHVRLRPDVIGSRSTLHYGSSRDRGQARATGDVRPA
jgi:hypothetical protein